jgi:hypothetical protein
MKLDEKQTFAALTRLREALEGNPRDCAQAALLLIPALFSKAHQSVLYDILRASHDDDEWMKLTPKGEAKVLELLQGN